MNDINNSRFETLGQWHDFWSTIKLFAPDKFREYDHSERKSVVIADQSVALLAAFDTLRSGLFFAERKVKDDVLFRIIRELIEMSFSAYCAGEKKTGAHTLQECEGLIWKSRQQPLKYVVEAERRVFGEVKRFADVRISRYPFEGTRNDLGDVQQSLLNSAETKSHEFLSKKTDFKRFALVRQKDSNIVEVFAPSTKKLMQNLTELAAKHDIEGTVIAELVGSGFSGLIVFELHERGYPRVDAISKMDDWLYQLRFHLHEPTIFPALSNES